MNNNKELTLKELLLSVKYYLFFFLIKWYWILLSSLIIACAFFFIAYRTPTTYTAPLTFMLEESNGSKGGVGAVLGQLGLSGNNDKSSGVKKILDLAKTRKIISPVLFDSLSIDGKKDLTLNHLIKVYDYHEYWKNNEPLKDFLFTSQILDSLTLTENRAFKQIQNLVVGPSFDTPLFSNQVDEESEIFTFKVIARRPEIADFLVSRIYEELSKYYINSSIASKSQTLNKLTQKADSVEMALIKAEAKLAQFEDASNQIFLKQRNLRKQQISREVLLLSTLYAEIVKNRETAAFLLANEKPAFQIIDEPIAALFPSGSDPLKSTIIGGFLGFLIAVFLLFFTKLFSDAVNS